MKRALVCLGLATGCGGAPSPEPLEAREDPGGEVADAVDAAPRASFEWMWRLGSSTADPADASWLVAVPEGTTDVDALLAPAPAVLDQVRAVVLDLDPSDPDPGAHPGAILGRRERLDRMLGRTAWQSATTRFSGIPGDELRQRAPWWLASHLDSERSPLRDALRTRALAAGREVAFLDPAADVVITELSERATADWLGALRTRLADEAAYATRSTQIREAAAQHDLTALRRACAAWPDGDPGAAEWAGQLLVARTFRWLPVIERHARDGHVLIAVDACILLAEHGLLEGLYESGLSVEQL